MADATSGQRLIIDDATDQPVLNLNLPVGGAITFLTFFAQGPTVLNYDLISAVRVP